MLHRTLPLLAFAAAPHFAHADALLNEPFAYADGELVAVSGGTWTITAIDTANPNLMVADEMLHWDYTVPSADPINIGYYGIPFSASKVDAGSVFYHFDLTVENAPEIEAGLFAAFWNGGNGLRARVWIGAGTEADTFRLGLTKASGSKSSVNWDTVNYAEGTTLRVVVEYDLDAGLALLYLDAASESAVTLTATDTGSDYGVNGFAVRNKDDGNLGKFSMDNLAVSLAFEDVGTATLEAPNKVSARAIPGERVFINWKDDATTETGFQVERSAGGAAYGTVATLDPNESYYVDDDVTVGIEYCYRVVALGAVASPASDPSCATVMADPVVEVVPSIEGDASEGDLLLTIHSQRAVSYQLEKSGDLLAWAPAGEGLPFGGIDGTIERTENVSEDSQFYRISGKLYPVPANVGLSEPFQMPVNGGGSVIDVSSHGATPGDSSDDDSVAFRAAMTAAQLGDTVLIPAGIYHVTSFVPVKSGVTVTGEGPESTTILCNTAVLSSVFNISSGSSDITIRDLGINLESGLLDYGVIIGTKTGSLVNRIWIYNLQIEGFAERGIMARQAKHVKVEDCRILNATNLGGGGFGYGIVFNDTNNNNNWATGCVIGPVIRHGILLQYETRNNLIEYNTIYGTSEDAIDLHGEDESANEVRFNLCYWDDPSGWDGTPVGIGIGNTGATHDDAGPFNWIHHNEVYGYNAGLEVILDSHHQYIDGNYFHDNITSGVVLNNGGGDGIALRGNIIKDNGAYGIRAEGSHAILIEDNTISGHGTGVSISSNSFGYQIFNNNLTGNATAKALGNDDGTYTGNEE